MHNNIMAVGSRDHPPTLATGRYAQWKSRFLRYIDTRLNGDALRKFILEGPYKLTIVTIPTVPATDDTPAVPERTAVETLLTMSPENKAHYESEKEEIHLLLTEIGDEIYSTIDACKTAHDMWIAIERLQQVILLQIFKKMNEMIRNNLTVATMQVNVQFLQQLQPEWSRFVTIVKQQHDLDTVSYHKLFDVLKQYQKEVNKIRAERIAKNANPLALVDVALPYPYPYYQAPKSHKPYETTSKQSSSTRSNASTKFKCKEIAKPITPLSESDSKEDSDPEQAQRDKDMQKKLALIAKYFKKLYKPTNNNLRTSSNSKNKNVDTTPRYVNENQTGILLRSAENKRAKDYTYHKEKMLMCKQAKKGVPLQAEEVDWLVDMDEEVDEQELESHYMYMYMEKIQEVHNVDSGPSFDVEPLEKVYSDDDYNVFANERQHSEQPVLLALKY
ncbi:hypothetical protein Tco_0980959 [Tanacetum coccineum]